jgi:hypothetical protein
MAQLKLEDPYVAEANDRVIRFGYGKDPREVEGFAIEPSGALTPLVRAKIASAPLHNGELLRSVQHARCDFLSYGEGIARFEQQEGCVELASFKNNGDYQVCLNVETRGNVGRYYLHPVALFSRCPGALTQHREEAARITTQAGALTLLLRAHPMVRTRFASANIQAYLVHHEDLDERPLCGATYLSAPIAMAAAYERLPEPLRRAFQEYQNFTQTLPSIAPEGSVHISGLWLDGHQGLTLDGFSQQDSQWIHRELGCVLRTSEGPGASLVPGLTPSQPVRSMSTVGNVICLKPTPLERVFGRSLEIDFYPHRLASENAVYEIEARAAR